MSIKIAIFELGSVPDEMKDKISGLLRNDLKTGYRLLCRRSTRVLVVHGEAIPDGKTLMALFIQALSTASGDDIVWIDLFPKNLQQHGFVKQTTVWYLLWASDYCASCGAASDRGWGCGMYEYEMRLDGESKKTLSVLTLHQDQVIEIPVDAKIVGGTKFCPMGAVHYAQAALTVQFHPEFSNEYMHDLLDLRGGVVIPIEIADAAKNTLNKKQSSAVVAAWAADFFHHELAP
ncbi:MAG: glutamine amidotransferase-related protein [Arenicellales bacterium WSBS_2016_MAG_OTU3]